MVFLSAAVHVAAFLTAVAWLYLSPADRRIKDPHAVMVVNLVGGFVPPPPQEAVSLPRSNEKPSKSQARREKAAPPPLPTVSRGMAPLTAKPPDTRELGDRVRQLRERRAAEEQLAQVRARIQGVRDVTDRIRDMQRRRAEHPPIDLSGLVTPVSRFGSGAPSANDRTPLEVKQFASSLMELVAGYWESNVPQSAAMVCSVIFTIDRDGRILAAEPEAGEWGSSAHDLYARRAITKLLSDQRSSRPLVMAPPASLLEGKPVVDVKVQMHGQTDGAVY